jgi:methylmalonyl-CoA mutase C-terminal domain/subunit
VDVVGLSILSGAHLTLFPRVIELLRQNGMSDVVVIGGGIIPSGDVAELEQMGVAGLYGPGTSLEEIVSAVRDHVARAREGVSA